MDESRRRIRSEIDSISKHIENLQKRRTELFRELDRLPKGRPGKPQSGVVRVEDFAPYIQKWVSDFDAIHDTSGRETLAERSGIHYHTISGILTGRAEFAQIDTADNLLTAIGRQDVADDLEVIPWTVHTRAKPQEPPTSQFYEE